MSFISGSEKNATELFMIGSFVRAYLLRDKLKKDVIKLTSEGRLYAQESYKELQGIS